MQKRNEIFVKPDHPLPGAAVLHQAILRTLSYYDIWQYPLSLGELYALLHGVALPFDRFRESLLHDGPGSGVAEDCGYYFIDRGSNDPVSHRKRREQHARRMWRLARIMTHLLKRSPFVRAVMISGDLSKNSTSSSSDIDFFILTEPGRLWIARSILILFKKIFLLNRKKLFCLNSFAIVGLPPSNERNVFQATEIVHLKPVFNRAAWEEYLAANVWVRGYFPNFEASHLFLPPCNNRPSRLQRVLEFPFRFLPSDRIDIALLCMMKKVWKRRYPQFDDETRERLFTTTRSESRAYAGNFEEKILVMFADRLNRIGLHD